jgi:Holliday junction resolvasome RuvABC endonuclease subunit
LKLSEARGVIRLALHQKLAQAEKSIIELSPTAVKKSAAGLGLGLSAKDEIHRILKFRFPELEALMSAPDALSHDALDALAVAWAALSISQSVQNPLNRLKETPGEV